MLLIKIFSFLLIFFHILHATTSFVIAEVSQQVSKKVGAESNISLQKEHQATKKSGKMLLHGNHAEHFFNTHQQLY